ncbi:hypothetical protein ACLKA7_000950 [Drosophila subpalustris]
MHPRRRRLHQQQQQQQLQLEVHRKKAAINAGLKRKFKMPLNRKPKRQLIEKQLDNFVEKLFDPKYLFDPNKEPDPKFNKPYEQALLRFIKFAEQNPDFDKHMDGGFSLGDDGPEYDMSDPDFTIDDLSGSDVSSYSKFYESRQSTSEEVIMISIQEGGQCQVTL